MDDISELVPEESLAPLKSKDIQVAKSLMQLEYMEVTYISCLNIILPSWITSSTFVIYLNRITTNKSWKQWFKAGREQKLKLFIAMDMIS